VDPVLQPDQQDCAQRDRRKVLIRPDPGKIARLSGLYQPQRSGLETITDGLSDGELASVLRFLRAASQGSGAIPGVS
jgi:hypothetical protein